MIEPAKSEELRSAEIPFVDPERVRRLVEMAARDPDQELKVHFITSVFANMGEIVQAMTDRSAPFRERLERMQKAAQAIEDLAMIHGYEGIETVAHNVARALVAVDRHAEREFSGKLQVRIGMALEAIQKILEFSGELNERVLIERAAGQVRPEMAPPDRASNVRPAQGESEPLSSLLGPPEVDSARVGEPEADLVSPEVAPRAPQPPEEEAGSDELEVEPGEQEWVLDEKPFDIREAEQLLRWIAEDAEVEEEGEAKGDESHRQEEPREEENIDELLSRMLSGSVHEVVSALDKLLASENGTTASAIDNAFVAFEALRDTAEKLRQKDLVSLCHSATEFLRADLAAGAPLPESHRDLLNQVAQALTALAQRPLGAEVKLRELTERLLQETYAGAEASDLLDEAVILELRRKLEDEDGGHQASLRGKVRRLLGI
jgi:hypothetical protein